MDETDIRLCQMLFVSSRAPVRELADKLGISVQATHRRMQLLKEEGLVHHYKASLSLGYLRAIRLLIEGRSTGSPEEVEKALRQNEMVQSVFVGEGQDHYFLECILHDIRDIDPLVEYMRTAVQMPEPHVLFDSQVRFGEKVLDSNYKGVPELSKLDHQIVNALHEDARMSVADIAARCDASVRTVTKHLDRLMEDGAVHFDIDWRPGNASGLTAQMAIILRKDADLKRTRDEIDRRFGGSLFLTASLSNVVGMVISNAWAPSMKKYNELIESIRNCPGVENVFSTVIKNGWMQDTWRDKLLREKAKVGQS